jgi:hypothetical protein
LDEDEQLNEDKSQQRWHPGLPDIFAIYFSHFS